MRKWPDWKKSDDDFLQSGHFLNVSVYADQNHAPSLTDVRLDVT